MIKYIGSKRTLVPTILQAIASVDTDDRPVVSVHDVFSGTSRVGHALKRAGYRVIASDCNAYAAVLARCYVQADAESVQVDAERLVEEFNRLPGEAGYFTETFCTRARFVQPRNGERIDAIRESIARKGLEPELEAVLLTALMEAADRVDSTTGLQMAYLKSWSRRSQNRLELRVPEVLPRARGGKGEAWCVDALEAAQRAAVDVAYIDPPYNHHSYLGNYHVWETLVRWDKPAVYGVACKREDVRERKSIFNSRRAFAGAMRTLMQSVRARVLVVSYSDEGFLPRDQMDALLTQAAGPGGRVRAVETDFPRYVGAKIGIYNARGEKVGRVGRLMNREFVFVVERAGGETNSEGSEWVEKLGVGEG